MKLRLPLFLLAGVCVAASSLRAQFTWIGNNGNPNAPLLITSPANWQSGNVPTGSGTEDVTFGDIAGGQPAVLIDVPGATVALRNITFNGSARPEYRFTGNGDNSFLQLNGNMTVGAGGNVVFQSGLQLLLGAGAHTVDIAGGVTVDSEATIAGPGALVKTGTGTLIVRAFTVHEGGTVIKNGVVQVNEATFGISDTDIVVGADSGDNGTLSASNGSTIVSKNALVAQLAGSTGTVTLSGSSADWSVLDTAYIGKGGTGTLTLANGADFASVRTEVGFLPGSFGNISLSGTSSWLNTGQFIIGNQGSALFSIADNSSVQAGDTILGNVSGGSGTLIITGSGSTFFTTSDSLVAGNQGGASLVLSNGGSLIIGDAGSGTLILGGDAGGSGTLNIGIGGSDMGGQLGASLVTTAGGSGHILLTTGGTSASPYYFTATGAVSGATIAIDGNLQIHNAGGYNTFKTSATHTGGTFITGGTLAIGANDVLPALGNVTVLAAADSTATFALQGLNQTVAHLTLGGVDSAAFSQVDIGSGGTLTFTGTLSFLATGDSEGALISGGSLILGGANIINVGNSSNAAHDLAITSNIGGAGSGLTKTGTGTLALSGTSTYTFGTTIQNGTLALLANGALPATRNVFLTPTAGVTARLQVGATTQTIGALTLGGTGANTSSQSVVELDPSGALTLGGNINFLSAGSPLGASISGGTLIFNSTLSIAVEDSAPAFYDLAIGSNITGTGGLVKSGAGALALLGTSSYSGGTTINGGRVGLGAVNALPIGGDVSIVPTISGTTRLELGSFSQSIGSLLLGGSAASTISSITIDSGATLSLGGNLTYNAANNPAGATIIGLGFSPQGILDLGSSSHTFAIGNSSNAAIDLSISAPIAGNGGGFTKTGAGMLYLSGINSYSGPTILNGGTLYIDADSALGTAPGSPTPGHLQFDGGTLYTFSGFTLNANRGISLGGSGGTFSIDSGGTLTYGGAAAGVGALTKTGLGTLLLSGANTYTGGTSVSSGVLTLGASNVLASGGNIVIAPLGSLSATFNVNGFSQAINALTFVGGTTGSTGIVTLGAGGTLTLGGNLFYDATNNPAGATISGGTLALSGNRTFSVGNSTTTTLDLTISSSISGGGFGFTKTGAGTLVLSGANTFTGGVLVNEGIVRLATNNALSGQNITINKLTTGSALLSVDGATSQSIGTLTFGGAGAINTAFNTVSLGTGTTLALGGTVTYNATNNPLGAAISNGTVALGPTRTFAIDDSAGTVNELTISSEISGAGFGLVKTGAGVLALTGVNTFSGSTSVVSGTLQIGADNGLGAAPGTPTAGHLSLDGGTLQNTADLALSANRGIALGSGGGTFNTGGGVTLSYGGVIAGPGALIKTGTGTLTLAGANSYNGGTALNNGRLVVSHPAALGSGALSFNGGELVVAPGITLSNTLNFTGSGGRIGGNGTFASAISAGPNVTLAPGLSPGATTFTGALTWATGGSYDFEVVSANGTAGTGYDTIVVTGSGSFNITATSGGKFNLNLLSLSNATTPGNVSDFLSSGTYTWQIASSANPITGFSADAFNINTGGFTNSLGTGNFSVSINGSNTAIFLNFSPIPEPSTYALLAFGAGAVFYTVRRRRRA